MKFNNILLVFFSVFVLFTVGFGLDFYHFVHTPLLIKEGGYVLAFPSGGSAQTLAKQLAADGVLKSPVHFIVWIRLQGSWRQLKAGEYFVKPNTTPRELIEQLKSGKVIQHALTIVPGWNFTRLMSEIEQSPHLRHSLTGLSASEIMARIGHPGEHPEGRFFAETYYFPAGTTDVRFLQRAYQLMQATLTNLWQNRTTPLPLHSEYEALILASIIEKESGIPGEYGDIAGVYIRRLQQKMPLQADPTVIYGVGDRFNGQLTQQMLLEKTPYNTYQQVGLPPTPIAFPSHGALLAALHPTEGDALYFVADPKGKGHIFSKTLLEHHLAVKEYRKAAGGKP